MQSLDYYIGQNQLLVTKLFLLVAVIAFIFLALRETANEGYDRIFCQFTCIIILAKCDWTGLKLSSHHNRFKPNLNRTEFYSHVDYFPPKMFILNSYLSFAHTQNISPGWVATEIVPDETKEMLGDVILQADDVAQAVMYALSTAPHTQVQEITLRAVGEWY